jgi:hypothetical protein
VGCPVGVDGFEVGCPVGCRVGCPVGCPVGLVGRDVGCPEGCPDGCPVGCPDGSTACISWVSSRVDVDEEKSCCVVRRESADRFIYLRCIHCIAYQTVQHCSMWGGIAEEGYSRGEDRVRRGGRSVAWCGLPVRRSTRSGNSPE